MNRPESPQNDEITEIAAIPMATVELDATGCTHNVLFYEDDDYLIEKLTIHFSAALESNAAAVVIASEVHLHALESRLVARGIDLEEAAYDDRYFKLTLDETLERFMLGGAPEPALFFQIFDDLIARASGEPSDTRRPVVVFGELVAKLVEDGNAEAAVNLEELWNQLAARRPFELLCAYPIGAFSTVKDAAALAAICNLHTHVTPAESFTQFERDDERQRAITQLQQRAIALENEVARRDRARQEDARREKAELDQFISVAAHELKTPISSLRAYTQLLLRGGRDGAVIDRSRFVDAVGAIETQTGKLTRLVSNVMRTLELEGGTVRIERLTVDLADLIRSTLRSEFADARHTIQFSGPTMCFVRADPHQIRQVILNLLDNSTKYSAPGSLVSIDLQQLDDGSTRLSVSDEGIGIAEEHRQEIFKRFYRAHVDSHQSGIGLGLYVARKIVELHGGTLSLEDTVTHGSRFVVDLPPVSGITALEQRFDQERSLPRVLVVDDDESIRQLIELVLEDEGFVVDFAPEGSAALDIINQRHPDLILLDMRMPGMDGWEFVDRYRAQYGHRAPIIVFTAAHDAAERSAEVDADGYIAKPFDLDTLIERVTAVIQKSAHTAQD